jgi:hypothetical protein
MSEPKPGSAEDIIAGIVSVPLHLIVGMAGLLISKGVISQQEMTSLLRHLIERQTHGESEKMVKMTLESLLAEFEKTPPG